MTGQARPRRPLVVWMAGMPWDGHEGTEVRFVRALGRRAEVLWFDPLVSVLRARRVRRPAPVTVAPGVTRFTTVGLPGVTRPGLGDLSQLRLWAAVRSEVDRRPGTDPVLVLSDPTGGFPADIDAPRLLVCRDDWTAGADLMGVPARRLARFERRNARRATAITAVSPDLARTLEGRTGRAVQVIANGCEPAPDIPLDDPVGRVGLVGNINERIDLTAVEAVAARGVPLEIAGPLAARDEDFRGRFTALAARPNVHWHGARPASEMPALLARMTVGITPYVDSAFNRASFPLKTLEYLAFGLRVVSSVLPANRWLDTPLVEETGSAAAFADAVVRGLGTELGPEERRTRIGFAARHSWDARAAELLALAGLHAREGAGVPSPAR
jgi:teichuronic acid biosynthesis glycosyltransferase TuaH